MQDVRSMPMRSNSVGRGGYSPNAGAATAEEYWDEDGFSYRDILQQYRGREHKSTQNKPHNHAPNHNSFAQAQHNPHGKTTVQHFAPMHQQMASGRPATNFNASRAFGSYAKQTGKPVPTPQRGKVAPTKGETGKAQMSGGKMPKPAIVGPGGIAPWYRQDATKGDVNLDGQIDKTDKDMMAEYVVRSLLDEYLGTDMAGKYAKENNMNVYAADLDNDGKVNISDIVDLNSIIKEMEKAQEEAKNVIKGDLNEDGEINGDDIELMKNLLVGNDVSANKKAADFDDDGKISVSDLSKLVDTFDEIKKQKATGIKGDLNNDGAVDIDDIAKLSDYVNGKNKGYDIYNDPDVNGDGEVDVADGEAIKNIYLYGKVQKPTGVTGDINNDGDVDISDTIAMKQYLQGQVKREDIYNEDVNKDGQVDESDLNAVTNVQLYGKIQKPSGVLGDTDNDGQVTLTDVARLKNFVDGREDATNVYGEDVNGDGNVDQDDVDTIRRMLIFDGKFQGNSGVTGDINNDGTVNADDQELLNRYLDGEVHYAQVNNEDVNGDGTVDRNDARNLHNLVQYGKMEKPTGILGDINNDGKVDATDIDRLKDSFEGRESHINVYNSNINGDDVVDQRDMDALNNLVNTGKIQQSNGVLGDINNDGKVDADDLNRFNQYLDGNISSSQINNEDVNGDGAVDRNDARNLSNLVQYGKMEKPTDINGDINNDGRVDAADIDKLKDLFEGRESHVNVYNANVNGDGTVDHGDMEALENLINYGSINKPAPPPPPPPPEPQPYQQWRSVATARIDVYEDPGLTNHIGNEKLFVGDPLDVLDENDNAYLVRYGVGTYPDYSYFKDRWVEKWAVDGANKPDPPSDNPAPPYQQWQAVISTRVPAYQDSGLSIRYGNEEVWVGDPVDVLNETDNAYYVRYGVGTYPDYSEFKDRWITKGAINGAAPVSSTPSNGYQPWQATVQTRMPAYHDANLTDRRNNEEVWVGDNVTILDENDRAYKMRYWSNVANDYKERWVAKAALSGTTQVNSAPASGYQPWEATVQSRMPAYHDANLTDRRNNEEVWVGDKVTILDETDNAYKMRYWSNVANDYKDRWVSKAALNPASEPNPAPAPGYQPWEATVQTRMPAYQNSDLTGRINNEEVWVGDKVTILDENDRAYKMKYWSNTENTYKERWVDKAALSVTTQPTPAPAPSYQPWEATVQQRMPAYRNSDLTGRVNNEEVWVGDKVTILDENDRAYKMKYWSNTDNGYKERWVDKAALSGATPSVSPVTPTTQVTGSVPIANLHVSEDGIRWIKTLEERNGQFSPTPYKALPTETYLTIGYGHYGADVTPGMRITEAQAEEYLRQDLAEAEALLKQYGSHLVLNQNQYDALVSFALNCSPNSVRQLLTGRTAEDIPEHLPYYCHDNATKTRIQGLVNRRAAELERYNTPVTGASTFTQVTPSVSSTGYQPWQATVQTRTPAYQNSNLTGRINNEEVWVGDKVTIVDENDRAYKMKYWSNTESTYKERWVDKAAISGATNDGRVVPSQDTVPANPFITPVVRPTNNPTSGTTSSTAKAGWTATVLYNKQVFNDPDLKIASQEGYNEVVFAKEKVTILEETDKAYKISYYSTKTNGNKERWIDKTAIGPATPPTPVVNPINTGVPAKLQHLIDEYENTTWDNSKYPNGIECKGFASYIFQELYGISYLGGGSTQYNSTNYLLNNLSPSVKLIDTKISMNAADARDLFAQATPGNFVQMKRNYLNSDGYYGAHSAIFVNKDDTGVWFLEANATKIYNKITYLHYTWEDLAKKNMAMSIYAAQ